MWSDKQHLVEGWNIHFGGSAHLDPMSSTPSLTEAEAQTFAEGYPLAGPHLPPLVPEPAVSEPSTAEALFKGLTPETLSLLSRQGRAAQERRRRRVPLPSKPAQTVLHDHESPAHRGRSSAPAGALVSQGTTNTSHSHSRHPSAWRPTISSPLRQQVSPAGPATPPQAGIQILPPAPQPISELTAQLIANTLAFYATHSHPRPLGSNPPERTQRSAEKERVAGLRSSQYRGQTHNHPLAQSQPPVSDGHEARHARVAPVADERSDIDVSGAGCSGLRRGRRICDRGKRVVRRLLGGCM